MGEETIRVAKDHLEGIWAGLFDTENNIKQLATEDDRINLDIPELKKWMDEIDPVLEAKDLELNPEIPFIPLPGNHTDTNANPQMRDPVWNEGKQACTFYINPKDAEKLGFADEQQVRVITDAGDGSIELEVTEATRPGYVIIPCGFGLVHKGAVLGVNANRLAKNTNRDRPAETPYHRYIPCRIEA